MAKKFRFPFAIDGDKTPLQDGTQADGAVNYQQGYTAQYSLDIESDPTARRIGRERFNQVVFDVTENLMQWQRQVFPDFTTQAENGGSAVQYPLHMIVRDNDTYRVSLTDNNVALPTDTSNWADLFPLPVSLGGTGANNAASARTNLGIGTQGEANTASNLGSGDGVFLDKNGVDLRFKSLIAGTNVTFDVTGTSITINGQAGDGGGEANTASNFGGTGDGVGVFHSKSGEDLRFRRIRSANSALTVTQLTDGSGGEIQLDIDTDNLVQSATTSRSGAVELATNTEARAMSSTSRVLTASNLVGISATTTTRGLTQFGSEGDYNTGTSTTRAVNIEQLARLRQINNIGSYGYFYIHSSASNRSLNPGSTIAGSQLRYSNAGGGDRPTSEIAAPSGTWRCLGQTRTGADDDGLATLFVRIA